MTIIRNLVSSDSKVKDVAEAKAVLGAVVGGLLQSKTVVDKIKTPREFLKSFSFNKRFLIRDAIAKSMPVARRWAVERMKNGEKFEDFEDEIIEIYAIERRLYLNMQQTFLDHIKHHGYDMNSIVFVEKLHHVKEFNHNEYNKLLSEMRKSFVKNNNHSVEYLISKTTEFVCKINEIGRAAYEMLQDGNRLDFSKWSAKMVLQDAVFEENKQFLKQTLKHFASMKNNKVKLGVSEIRLLLNQKDGCRREKYYHQAEEWIISIYNSLPADTKQEKEEQAQIYKEICAFVYDIIPLTGRISINMINFIFDRGFLSPMSRDLLLKIRPRINSLSMTPLFHYPLMHMLENVYADYRLGELSQSDWCVLEVTAAYEPELMNIELQRLYEQHLEENKA